MKKVEKTNNQIVFTVNISETLANSIRRYINQVLVMAVDNVEISRNDSALYDEAIAHRIGLIPLKSEKSVNEKSTGKLKLEVKKSGLVYSKELKGTPNVVFNNLPITTLADGQELKLLAIAKSGRGVEHSKFSPGLMFYRNVSEITMDKDLQEEVKKVCPENDIKEKSGKFVITDDRKKEILDFCEGFAKKKGKKAGVETKDELVITLESFEQMTPEDVFKRSVDALKKDLVTIQKSLRKA